MQMYKVFVNDNPVYFGNKHTKLEGFDIQNFNSSTIPKLIEELMENSNKKYLIVCDNLEQDWIDFCSFFEVRPAAGGVVINDKNEILWIYRFDKWDLPKGHVEEGESIEETAIREVEEECGVSGLTLKKELPTTYHIYMHKGRYVLKKSHWFLMDISFTGKLIPQEEEGITKVIFKNIGDSQKCLSNTYENIKLLLTDYLKVL